MQPGGDLAIGSRDVVALEKSADLGASNQAKATSVLAPIAKRIVQVCQ